MNNWQEWVVGVLVVLCIVRLVYGIYTFFRRTRDSGNPCDSCVSVCVLKDMMDKKRKECGVKNICRLKKMSYLCNRNRETKIANDKVPWMSGLVSGLQNRVRRFESARNLQNWEGLEGNF